MTTTTHDTVSGAADDLARQLAEVGHGHVLLAPGNATLYEVAVLRVEGGWVVAVPGGGAYRFGDLCGVHWSYAHEKLDLLPADAVVVADLLDATGTEVARLVVG